MQTKRLFTRTTVVVCCALLNLCHKEFRQVWRQKEGQPDKVAGILELNNVCPSSIYNLWTLTHAASEGAWVGCACNRVRGEDILNRLPFHHRAHIYKQPIQSHLLTRSACFSTVKESQSTQTEPRRHKPIQTPQRVNWEPNPGPSCLKIPVFTNVPQYTHRF